MIKIVPTGSRLAIILLPSNIAGCVAGIGSEATPMPAFWRSDQPLPMDAAKVAIVAADLGIGIGLGGLRFASTRWLHVVLIGFGLAAAGPAVATISSSRVM